MVAIRANADGVASPALAKLTSVDILLAPSMAVATPKMAHYVNFWPHFVNILPKFVYLFARFSKFWTLVAGRDQPPHAMLLIGKLKFTRSKGSTCLGASEF